MSLCALVGAAVLIMPGPVVATQAATFAQAGNDALATLLHAYYAGGGAWRECNAPACAVARGDWGADSLTNALYVAWRSSHDAAVGSAIAAVGAAVPRYGALCRAGGCPYWSDTPAWDAVTLMRAYEVTGEGAFLRRAQAALRYVFDSPAFSGGACSTIPYQRSMDSGAQVKTLETDANATKAALLLYRATGERSYLRAAIMHYAADRRRFLDPAVPLYTVHVVDDGTHCVQVPRRFFASVNGDMIWNGLALWHATGRSSFYHDAIATAEAVDTYLSDGRGVFIDLQGENDVEEPLVEAMDDLAVQQRMAFARAWILRNAGAAFAGRAPTGAFSRFFDGPAQPVASAWEANGGLTLEIAAASLAGSQAVPTSDAWAGGSFLTRAVTKLPATIAFDGSGIALVGTMSATCEHEHVRVYVDGVETFDRTGLWQNPSMPAGPSVLFAWRWAKPGRHTIELKPGGPEELGRGIVDLESMVTYSSRT